MRSSSSRVAASSHCRSSREQRQRCSGERPEEAPEHKLEAVLRLSWRQVGNGRLFSDDELYLGDEIDDQLAVRTYGLRQGTPPLVQLRFALDEDLTDQCLEGFCQGGRACTGRILPAAKGPRGGTSTLCSSFNTQDLPTPE